MWELVPRLHGVLSRSQGGPVSHGQVATFGFHVPRPLRNVFSIQPTVRSKRSGSLLHCGWDCGMTQPLQKTIWQLLKLNINLPYDPGIPLLGVWPREMQARVHTQTRARRLAAALCTTVKMRKRHRCPSPMDGGLSWFCAHFCGMSGTGRGMKNLLR